MVKAKDPEVAVDRRVSDERRGGRDRREEDVRVATDRRTSDRRKVQRRRQIDPTTCERDYTADEIEFMQAMDAYKRSSGRMFPTCSEILEVVRNLGYQKVSDPGQSGQSPLQAQDSAASDEATGLETALDVE